MARDRTKHFSESDIRNRIFDADGDFIYTSDIAMDIAVGNVAGATFVDKFGETGEGITEYDAEGNEVIYYPIAFEEEAPA